MVGECEGEGRNGGESLSLPLTNRFKKQEIVLVYFLFRMSSYSVSI